MKPKTVFVALTALALAVPPWHWRAGPYSGRGWRPIVTPLRSDASIDLTTLGVEIALAGVLSYGVAWARYGKGRPDGSRT